MTNTDKTSQWEGDISYTLVQGKVKTSINLCPCHDDYILMHITVETDDEKFSWSFFPKRLTKNGEQLDIYGDPRFIDGGRIVYERVKPE